MRNRGVEELGWGRAADISLSCFRSRDKARILMLLFSFSYQPCFVHLGPSLRSVCYCRGWGCCWGVASCSP